MLANVKKELVKPQHIKLSVMSVNWESLLPRTGPRGWFKLYKIYSLAEATRMSYKYAGAVGMMGHL